MEGFTVKGRQSSGNMAGNESGFLRTDKFVRDLDRQLDNLLGEGGSFDDLTPEQQKVVLANINNPNYNSEETEDRVIGDDNLNIPPQSGPGMRRPESPFDSETDRRGFGDAPGSILGTNLDAGENWGGQLESRLFDSRGNPIDAGMVSSTDTDQPIRPDNPLAPKPPSPRDSGTMVDPQKDLSHYFESDELLRRAIENGSLPLNQLTDEQQKALKVGPYAVDPKLEGSQDAIDKALEGLEGEPPLTPEEGTPPERLGEATDDERKQQLIDGVANGDIDPLLISKDELTALGIEGKDLVLPAPSKDFITKTREKIMGTIGDLAEDLGPAIATATTPPSLEEMLDPNNGAAWQIGVRIDANGDSQLFVKIGLPIPGLTGDGWEIDLTKDGQLVIDDAIKRKAGEIWENTKKIPEKIGGWWGGVKQEIEDAGEDIKDAALDKDGNVLITVIESTGKVVKRVLRPLEIFLPQVDLGKDPTYGAKVRNGVLGIFILGKIADKIKNKDKPSSSPPAGGPPAGSPPAEFDGAGEGPPPNNDPFVSVLDTGDIDPDDDKPSSSLPIPPDNGPTIPPDSGADVDAGGGGNNPFFSIPGGSRNRRTEEYESKEGGALEYFFNMAGTSIFATAEQEADFLSAYMRIMDRRKAEDREVPPDKLVSPLTGVNISNPNKKTSEEDEPITVQKASGGLINGNFMNEYNRIMRHRVG
jgi:hypothetical protein